MSKKHEYVVETFIIETCQAESKRRESYDETLKVLAEAKPTTDNFFDKVIVNDENSDIKKNRLELLQMFCKTYNNFVDFSKMEGA